MKKSATKIVSLMLCAIFSMQVLLPLTMCIAIGVVKESQEKFIRLHADENAGFEEFILSEREYISARLDDHEIVLAGKTYDVVSARLSNGKYIVKVLADSREDRLKDVNESLSKEKRNSLGSVIGLCFSLAIIQTTAHSFTQLQQPFSFPVTEVSSWESNVGKVPTPPPDVLI